MLRPVKLVAFAAAEKIILMVARLNCMLDRTAHDHEPYARLRQGWVDTALVEAEAAAGGEPIKGGHCLAVDREQVQPDPSAVRQPPDDGFMKGQCARGEECAHRVFLLESQPMQPDQFRKGCLQ